MKLKIKKNKYTVLAIFVTIALIVVLGSIFIFKDNKVEAAWWNDSWNYRKAITINSDQVAGDLVDFPMLVSLTDTSLGTHAQEDGDDIIFIDSEGKKLKHEVESFATSTGVLVAWVKIPALSSTEDVDIYMYYGNGSVSNQQDAENVWDENFKLIQHLQEDGTGTRFDSTGNNNDGTPSGYEGDEATTTAKINGADDFDGGNDYVYDDPTDQTGSFTVSFWAKAGSTGQDEHSGLFSSENPIDDDSFQIDVGGSTDGCANMYGFFITNSSGDGQDRICMGTYTTNWQFLTATWDGTTAKGYLNGVFQNSATPSYTGNIDEYIVGVNRGLNNFFDGTMDEVRISNTARSANWIETSFNNQNDPTAFFADQDEEVGPGPVGYWSFDEGYGTTAYDESSNKNDGTITGATWQDESMCVSGKCLYFDGVDLTNVTADAPDNMDVFTSCVWFKANSLINEDGDSIIDITGKGGGIEFDNNGKIKFSVSTTDVYTQLYGVENIEINKWYFVCGIFNGIGNEPKLYINGADKGMSISLGSGTRDDSAGIFRIGASEEKSI